MATKPIIDLSKFAFGTEEIRALNELTFDDVIKTPEISSLMTVFPGIVFNKEIGFLGEGGLIGKGGYGCKPSSDNFQISSRKITWAPKSWSTLIEQCFTDLQSTAAIYSMNTGVDTADFTNTDIMNIVGEALTNAMKKFIMRLAWFNDTAVKNFSDSGTLTNDVSVDYFNILDGLFKQIDIQCTSNAKQKVAIAENAGASFEAQKMDDTKVQGYLAKLYYQASPILRQMQGNVILCTQSFADSYQRSLSGLQLETMLANLTDGKSSLSYNGIPIVAMPIWDEMITNYFNNGTKLVNPNRALFTNQRVLGLAVDNLNSFENFSTWYEKKDREVYTDIAGKADVKLMNEKLFVYAG